MNSSGKKRRNEERHNNRHAELLSPARHCELVGVGLGMGSDDHTKS